MSGLQPITFYSHIAGPNPYKVAIALEELGIPYKKIVVDNPKAEWFTAINPNGRVPAIVDPNTGLTLWESGAIVEYLVETYDKEGKLTVPDTAGKWHLKQYLHFQMSGQGPYYGQAMWFYKCPEDIPIAKQRYIEQIARVVEVLDNILKGKQYLLNEKFTYADLTFIPWNQVVAKAPFFTESLWKAYEIEKKYPNYVAWTERIANRPSVQRAYSN
ncbi:putative glutathione s- protein [Eutypa lata UCREL1]|uniref:Putative glutathione s-protein n=1 Tax=Eutypa lata (strain UCR-EL1) TaxID=1287681 RepID=M7TS12_EUTLA|nr:putative glutathione s- protein [Eutypa lata UCREL1]